MADTVTTAAGWAAGLDGAQLGAVAHDGPALIIVAGAGTGKTRTLVARVARVVEGGVPPDRVLLVTFSRRAADELVRRLGHLVGAEAARRVIAAPFTPSPTGCCDSRATGWVSAVVFGARSR